MVESDVFNIAQRIKEIDSRLELWLIEGKKKPWIIYERVNGEPQVVQRYEELTPQILDDLRYMAAVPFTERVKKISDEIDRENERLGKMDPEKFERFAYDFRKALLYANMIDTPDFSSYRNTAGRRTRSL